MPALPAAVLRALCVCAFLMLAGCSPMPRATGPAAAVDAIGTPPASSIYIGNSFFYFNDGFTTHNEAT